MTALPRPRTPAGDASERLPVHPAVRLAIGPHGLPDLADAKAVIDAIHVAKPVEDDVARAVLARHVEAFASTGNAEETVSVLGVQVRLVRVRG